MGNKQNNEHKVEFPDLNLVGRIERNYDEENDELDGDFASMFGDISPSTKIQRQRPGITVYWRTKLSGNTGDRLGIRFLFVVGKEKKLIMVYSHDLIQILNANNAKKRKTVRKPFSTRVLDMIQWDDDEFLCSTAETPFGLHSFRVHPNFVVLNSFPSLSISYVKGLSNRIKKLKKLDGKYFLTIHHNQIRIIEYESGRILNCCDFPKHEFYSPYPVLSKKYTDCFFVNENKDLKIISWETTNNTLKLLKRLKNLGKFQMAVSMINDDNDEILISIGNYDFFRAENISKLLYEDDGNSLGKKKSSINSCSVTLGPRISSKSVCTMSMIELKRKYLCVMDFSSNVRVYRMITPKTPSEGGSEEERIKPCISIDLVVESGQVIKNVSTTDYSSYSNGRGFVLYRMNKERDLELFCHSHFNVTRFSLVGVVSYFQDWEDLVRENSKDVKERIEYLMDVIRGELDFSEQKEEVSWFREIRIGGNTLVSNIFPSFLLSC